MNECSPLFSNEPNTSRLQYGVKSKIAPPLTLPLDTTSPFILSDISFNYIFWKICLLFTWRILRIALKNHYIQNFDISMFTTVVTPFLYNSIYLIKNGCFQQKSNMDRNFLKQHFLLIITFPVFFFNNNWMFILFNALWTIELFFNILSLIYSNSQLFSSITSTFWMINYIIYSYIKLSFFHSYKQWFL